MMKERISKILASCNVASRRKSEMMILQGRVRVNGIIVTNLGDKFSPDEDIIELDGQIIAKPQEKLYIALNKPLGFECSKTDNKRSIYNLLGKLKDKLFSVGRLDVETSGLIFLTNDGNFCNNICHPSNGIKKHYLAVFGSEVKKHHIEKIAKGTYINKSFSKPISVEKIGTNKMNIVVAEGKKHEVRILVSLSDLELLALQRTQIGNFKLGTLPVGKWREISKKNIFGDGK